MLRKCNTAKINNKTNAEITSSNITDSSLHTKWLETKNILVRELGETTFKNWIAPISAQSLNAGILELAVPTRFIRDWIKTHYIDKIRSVWARKFGNLKRINIIIIESVTSKKSSLANPANSNSSKTSDFDKTQEISSPLDARFTFDNFIVGKPNELAYAAAKRVVESKKTAFNPLFLYGGVGLGKTHLMHAIAWAIKEKTPDRKIIYMSAEKFMYQFVRALRFKDTMSFKDIFRSVDILMIDDIQFICGKESTQEEFFHTFNALIDQNKQIIVSADKSPSDLDGLEERLRSRLGWGLVADIHPTTYELRLGILEQKREMLKREIPQNVLEFLAHKITSNVRELEGALNRVIAHSELIGCAVTIDTTQDLLQDLLRANDTRVSIEDIQKQVAEHYNIRVRDMHSPRRSRIIARPRQIAMYISKQLTEHSLPEIGRKFGGRDHTTIIHGVRRIEELMSKDNVMKEDVALLIRAIRR